MSDGAIAHHALDVVLADGNEVADGHRERAEYGEGGTPVEAESVGGEGDVEDAEDYGESCRLACHGQELRYGRGSAFVHVGRPHLEGDAGNLEAEAGDHQDDAEHEGTAAEGGAAAEVAA